MNLLRRLYERTKEPFSYFGDLLEILKTFYTIILTIIIFSNNAEFNEFRVALLNLNPFIKVLLFILLIISLCYWLRKLYENALFYFESSRFRSGIDYHNSSSNLDTIIDNYNKLIPSTRIVETIYDEFFTRAKQWSGDCYLAGSGMVILLKKGGISVDTTFEFFSKSKKLTLKLNTLGLKIPKETKISPNQLKNDKTRVQKRPFFYEKKWRKFIVKALQLIEGEIAGKEFYLSVESNVLDITEFYLDAGAVPHRSYVFFLKYGKAYSDLSLNEEVYEL
jgi:hypothetical protein